MIPALLLWLALSSRVELVNKTFEIPAGEWRFWDHPLVEQPAMVVCEFQSRRDSHVRLVLVERNDLDAWLAGREHEELAATPIGARGSLRLAITEPDTYVVIDNRGARPAAVQLGVFLEQPQVHYLSRGRRLAVVAISFGIFFAVGSFSAVKLLKAVRS